MVPTWREQTTSDRQILSSSPPPSGNKLRCPLNKRRWLLSKGMQQHKFLLCGPKISINSVHPPATAVTSCQCKVGFSSGQNLMYTTMSMYQLNCYPRYFGTNKICLYFLVYCSLYISNTRTIIYIFSPFILCTMTLRNKQ